MGFFPGSRLHGVPLRHLVWGGRDGRRQLARLRCQPRQPRLRSLVSGRASAPICCGALRVREAFILERRVGGVRIEDVRWGDTTRPKQAVIQFGVYPRFPFCGVRDCQNRGMRFQTATAGSGTEKRNSFIC